MVAAWTSVRTAFAPLTDGGISSHFLMAGNACRVATSPALIRAAVCTNASYSNPFVRFNDQVRCFLPVTRAHVLCDGKTLPDHIEKMAWRRASGPAAPQVTRQNSSRSHLDQWPRRHRVGQHSIHQPAPTNVHRQKHAGIRTAGAYR